MKRSQGEDLLCIKNETFLKSKDMLQQVFDCSYDAIIVGEVDGNLIDCNHRALELFGLKGKDKLFRDTMKIIDTTNF